MAPIARSKCPLAVSSNHTDSTTVRRLHWTLSPSCSIAWIACAHSLKLGDVAHQEIETLDAVGVARRGHQRLGFLDRGVRCPPGSRRA